MLAVRFASLFVLASVVIGAPKDVARRSKRSIFFQTKCFGEFGCFNSGGDFYNLIFRPLTTVPQNYSVIAPRFELFTRKNVVIGQELQLNNEDMLSDSFFNASLPTKVITHGFLSNDLNNDAVTKMRRAFLLAGDYNVILLDWSKGAKDTSYMQATANARLVGVVLAHFIKFIEEKTGSDRKDFHVIGHSLGAHLAGYTGEKLEGKLGRISGLDPAGPFFYKMKPTVRLDPTDAVLVDNIHTNNVLGTEQAMGHVDYYPNGGKQQPNCTQSLILKESHVCDHERVWALFTDTILASSTCQFKAYSCDSYQSFKEANCVFDDEDSVNYMGLNTIKRSGQSELKLYLETAGKENFCVHQYFLAIKTGIGKYFYTVNGNMFVTFGGSKGKTDKIQFFSKSQTIKPETSYVRSFSQVKNIGTVHNVTFSWQKSFFTTEDLHLDRITLFNGHDESSNTFFGCNKNIANGLDVFIEGSRLFDQQVCLK